jgi:hypothetical protein
VRKRIFASSAIGVMLIGAAMSLPAQATAGASGVGPAVAFKPYGKPVAAYKHNTCVIDLSGIVDGATLDSIHQCGVTVTFSVTMTKATVPNGGWSNWGHPNDTESSTPNVLYFSSGHRISLTFSKAVRRTGLEMEGDPYATASFSANFMHGTSPVGTVTRDVTTPDGARLFAGDAGAPKANWITSIILSDNNGGNFGIAQIRV